MKVLKLIIQLVIISFFSFLNYGAAQNNDEITIGSQTWMKKNLDISEFRNGEKISQAKSMEKWIDACNKKQAVWCYYDFNPANGKTYGKLYNWYAVNDKRGLAPDGMRIPEHKDWVELNNTLGNLLTNAEKLKSETGWAESPKSKGTNSSGFSALPGGSLSCYHENDTSIVSNFTFLLKQGNWWTSEEKGTTSHILDTASICYSLTYSIPNSTIGIRTCGQCSGLSVRCLKNN